MLAYVFCHWKQPGVVTSDYEARQRAFHAALAEAPSPGFLGSFCAGITGAPWAAEGAAAYEDWYRVDDFTALGELNQAAVSASRAAPHDAAAALAAGGAGAVYALRLGSELRSPRHALWFSKPVGMRYEDLFTRLAPLVEQSRGALWMRQMVLGPAREFCLQGAQPIDLPSNLSALALELRPIWPAPWEG